MKIQIPKKLDLFSTLNFCNTIDSIQEDDVYVYDYENMSTVEPFGMLLLGSKIRKFVGLKEGCSHEDCNFEGNKYAAHMGFFKSVYQDFGKEPGEASGSNRYIPITNINIKDIKNKAIRNKKDIYEYIEDIAKDLTKVLSRNNETLMKCLSYSIMELLRNVYEHSDSEELWYAAQYWPSKNMVEIAILDEGIGIRNSFQKNKKINVKNDEEAIKLALSPGISKSGIGKVSSDAYDNTGFGLYMISNICKNGGDFVICSGSKCLVINSKETCVHETSFNGTVIRMRIRPSEITKLSEVMSNLSRTGTKEAKKYKGLSEISIESISNV